MEDTVYRTAPNFPKGDTPMERGIRPSTLRLSTHTLDTLDTLDAMLKTKRSLK